MESKLGFFALSPSEVYASSYVGEAEGRIRAVFEAARNAKPSCVFFDEIDGIVGTGGGLDRSGSGSEYEVESRVLATFLNEMDGVDSAKGDGVFVLGATNRPWELDKALLRAGRFDKKVYVGPPEEPREVWRIHLRRVEDNAARSGSGSGSGSGIDYDKLGKATKGWTGAEIEGACNAALRRMLSIELDKIEGDGETEEEEEEEEEEKSSLMELLMAAIENFGQPLLEKNPKLFQNFDKFM